MTHPDYIKKRDALIANLPDSRDYEDYGDYLIARDEVAQAIDALVEALIVEERRDEVNKMPDGSPYSIVSSDTAYKRGWRTGATRLHTEIKRYKDKRLAELQGGDKEEAA